MSFSIIFSVGKYKGFDVRVGIQKQLVLGWFSISLVVPEFDQVVDELIAYSWVRDVGDVHD